MTKHSRVRDLREDKDLKQKEIAAHRDCDQSLYSKYERGEREIPLHLFIRLADYCHVSLDYLAGRTSKKDGCRKNSSAAEGQNSIDKKTSVLFPDPFIKYIMKCIRANPQ